LYTALGYQVKTSTNQWKGTS